MSGVDFVGILANGKMFRGNANSLGQKHWFETDNHSLDYSLVTSNHQMVKLVHHQKRILNNQWKH